MADEQVVPTRSSFWGDGRPRFVMAGPQRVLAIPAEAQTIIHHREGDQPEILVVSWHGGMGLGMGYTSPAALEAWADKLREAAQLLRVQPQPEPEVRR